MQKRKKNLNNLFRFFFKPFRYDVLNSWLKQDGVVVLDIGCGNHSASKIKIYYPNCKYYGLDINKNYNNSERDFLAMEDFYEINLNKEPEKLDIISDNFFDVIIMSHIIEHLKEGEKILLKLTSKLKKGGMIYIETPAPKTAKFPKYFGLNFYGDSTHIRPYAISNLDKLLHDNNFEIIKEGTRRSLKRIILLPFYFVGAIVYYKNIPASIFYDLVGFANYLIAIKK